MVRSDVAATPSKAQGAHQGQDNSSVSSDFVMTSKSLRQRSGSVE